MLDKQTWIQVVTKGEEGGSEDSAKLTSKDMLMQVVLQDTKPGQTFSAPSLRTAWRHRQETLFKGALADKLSDAIQALLTGQLVENAEKRDNVTKDQTKHSKLAGYFRKIPVNRHGSEAESLRKHLRVNASHFPDAAA